MGVLSLLPKKSGPGLRLRTDRRPSSGPALLEAWTLHQKLPAAATLVPGRLRTLSNCS